MLIPWVLPSFSRMWRGIVQLNWPLIAILGLAFLLRFAAYDNPLSSNGGDAGRDFLNVYHSVEYGEWPLFGPPAGDGMRDFSSPLYWYVLILPALVFNSESFVNLAFIVFQTVAVLGIFLITRTLFGARAAVIAALVASLAPLRIAQSAGFVWQPYVMEPVLIFGVYFGVRGAVSGSLRWIYLSIVVVVAALALHLSVLGTLPLYGAVVGYVLYRIDGWRAFAKGGVLGVVMFMIFFAPFLIRLVPLWSDIVVEPYPPGHSRAPSTVLEKIPMALAGVTSQFMPTILLPMPRPVSGTLFGALACLVAVYAFRSRRVPEIRRAIILLAAVVGVQLLVVILAARHADYRHVLPAAWASFVLIGGVASLVWSTSRVARAALCAVVIVWASIWFQSPSVRLMLANIPSFERPQQKALDAAVVSVVREIVDIKRSREYSTYRFSSFFGVYALPASVEQAQSGLFLAPVERALGIPIVSRTSHWHRDFNNIDSNPYVFVFCSAEKGFSIPQTYPLCVNLFKKLFPPTYRLMKIVYQSPVLVVYEMYNDKSAR